MMLTSAAKPFPAPIREKLDKLIRRLSSDSDGECVATVRAIARTLSGSGLDWHDLAVRVSMSTGAELMVEFGGPAAARPAPARPAPTYSYPPAPEPQKSPWPTWGNVGGPQGRILWMQGVRATKEYAGMRKRREFDALLAKIYQRPHETVSRKEINLFNISVRVAWEFGLRVETQRGAWR